METEPDPPTLALASSLATSTLGGSLSSTLGGATQQERLGLLVGKLGHALREVYIVRMDGWTQQQSNMHACSRPSLIPNHAPFRLDHTTRCACARCGTCA